MQNTFFSRLQFVCIWALATRQEVCPRLLLSMLIKTLNIIRYNLKGFLPNKRNKQISHLFFTTEVKWVTAKGSAMIPTQRSVIARLRYRSLDGGWSEVSLCREPRIRVFTRNALMERKIFSAERKIARNLHLWRIPPNRIVLRLFCCHLQ